MKNAGKAKIAALKILGLTAIPVAALLGAAIWQAGPALRFLAVALAVVWVLFSIFTMNFFRDPDASVPPDRKVVLSPAHGTVDVVGTTTENEIMGGLCHRISIFLSVLDVHVQKAPIDARVTQLKHTDGQFLSALREDCAEHNENVLVGLEPTDPGVKPMAVRLIAGLIARRIVPWVRVGEVITRGERISLVQFGSRADIYLPRDAKIRVRPNDRVVGGETILAHYD